ncbi:MAG: terminase large subunit domain-containing protein [Armatimonadota bacterium]
MIATDLRYAVDPTVFARECLGITPDPWQSQVLLSAKSRLLLNCSRQSGKSTTASVLALHTALYRPESLILLVSPSLRQSGELFRKVVELVSDLPERPRLSEENKLSMRLENGARIVSLPGSEATIRGFSAPSLVIEDEASRVPDDLYRAVRPMLAVSSGRLILMSTPFGKRGHFYDEWEQEGSEWERIAISAAECPRISAEFLAEERRSLGDLWFRQEYGCEFLATMDQLFDYDTVMACITPDVKPLFSAA